MKEKIYVGKTKNEFVEWKIASISGSITGTPPTEEDKERAKQKLEELKKKKSGEA